MEEKFPVLNIVMIESTCFGEKPYYFQYNHKAFKIHAVYACIRFLLHGLRFETQEALL